MGAQESFSINVPVKVKYVFGKPDRRRRDVANLEKAVSDLLVSQGVLGDDSLIQSCTVEWGCWGYKVGVDITIEQYL